MTDEITYFTGRHPDGSLLVPHHAQLSFERAEALAWMDAARKRPLLTALALRLIKRAEKTPYFHLKGYMLRFWVRQPPGRSDNSSDYDGRGGIGARVHHILRSDDDRHMHGHPWWNISLVLRDGYWEVTPEGRFWRGPGSIVFRRATDIHCLELPAGITTWSLFIMGRKTREWGFHTPQGWVHHRAYVQMFGERT